MRSVPTRQRTLSGRTSSAARRHSTAARPSQSDASPLAQSAAHRPPNPHSKHLQPTLASPITRGDSRYRWLGRFVLVHSRPATTLLLVLRARPDLFLNRFQRPRCLLELDPARSGNGQRSRSRSRSRAWVGTDQRLRMALAVRFVMNLAALAPQFPMPNCRTCLTRWPSSAALQPRAST